MASGFCLKWIKNIGTLRYRSFTAGRVLFPESFIFKRSYSIKLNLPIKEKCKFYSTRSIHIRNRGDALFKYLLLAIPIGTFGLGTWQVRRRKWKLDLIAELNEKTSIDPMDFPQSYEDLLNMEYRKVKLCGIFDHTKEIYIGPRPLVVSGAFKSSGSMMTSGQSGFYVITPLKLLDRNLTILVNRGWVNRKNKNPATRTTGLTEGPVEFTAVIRSNENRPQFMQKTPEGATTFLYRDIDQMAFVTDSSPILVDAVETFPDGPIGGQTTVKLRNEHLSYLITWYSLSIATCFLWYKRFILKKSLM